MTLSPSAVIEALDDIPMKEWQVRCAACGMPGHRYGRNEGMERFDPQACINGLLHRLEATAAAARSWVEGEEIRYCEVHRKPYPHETGPSGAQPPCNIVSARICLDGGNT